MRVHPKSLLKLKSKLKMLTGRSNGMGYERRKVALHQVIRGWVSYFKYADAKTSLTTIDQWLRRRIRMCIWKAWKLPKTRIKNLIRCGINKYDASRWGYIKGFWRVSSSPIMHLAVSSQRLREAGYPTLMGSYLEWCPKIGTAVCGTARTVV